MGSSRLYLCLEDSLMRIFASDRMSSMMQRFGMKEDEAIEAGMLNREIENTQRKVEAHNIDVQAPVKDWLAEDEQIHEEVLRERIIEIVDTHFQTKEEQTGAEVMRKLPLK